MRGQALSQTRKERGIQIGEGEPVGTKDCGVQKIEHLAGSGSGDGDAAARGQRCPLDEPGGEDGGGLGLADGRHVRIVIAGGDDFGPGAA